MLKSFDFGEADRILTLYTPNLGKLRAVVKGVRRTRSKMAGHLDLFTRSSLMLARGRQLDIVTQAEALDVFAPLRTDLSRLAAASYVAELLDAFGAEELPNYAMYSLAVETLGRLSQTGNIDLTLRSYELQLLGFAGYRPQLHRCLHCEGTIEPGANLFSAAMGGVLCPACGGTDRSATPISVPALKLLRNLQMNGSAALHLRAIPPEVMAEAEKRMHEHVMYRLESRPRSIAFLERLRQEAVR